MASNTYIGFFFLAPILKLGFMDSIAIKHLSIDCIVGFGV